MPANIGVWIREGILSLRSIAHMKRLFRYALSDCLYFVVCTINVRLRLDSV